MPPSARPLLLALALTAACSHTDTDTTKPEPAGNPPPTAPAATSPAATPAPPAEDTKAPPERLAADDVRFGVLATINEQAIAEAELAAHHSRSAEVKKFASEIIQDHKNLQERQTMTRDRLGLRATDSRLSDDIETHGDKELRTLKDSPRGDPFDRAFVDVQVENYSAWIDFIDTKLLPAAQTPDLRTELTEARARFEARLSQARALQTTLAKPKT